MKYGTKQKPEHRKVHWTNINGMFVIVAALAATILTASLTEARFLEQKRIMAEKTTADSSIKLAHCPLSSLIRYKSAM